MRHYDYDYAEIETYIAEARRLRSEALGLYLAQAGQALGRAARKLATWVAHKAAAKKPDRNPGPYLPV